MCSWSKIGGAVEVVKWEKKEKLFSFHFKFSGGGMGFVFRFRDLG